MKLEKYEVPVDKLCWRCDPTQFKFERTDELPPLQDFIGQDRAIRAIEFGLSIERDGYNIYVAGFSGTGKTTAVKTYIEKLIAEREAKGEVFQPDDWCYLHNFTETDWPQIASLPRGKGKVFREQINSLLESLKVEFQRAFSSDDYKTQVKQAVDEGQIEQKKIFEKLGEQARRKGFILELTSGGPALIPLAEDKPMDQAAYLALGEPARKKLEEKRSELLKKLQISIEKAQDLERQKVDKVRKVDSEVGDFTTSKLFSKLLDEYSDSDTITGYVTDLRAYTLENLNLFKGQEEQAPAVLGLPSGLMQAGRDPLLPFQVNVFVDNSDTKGPPVIIEANPNFVNLFGRIERRFLLGGYLSDHTMLKPGALSMANGGYLLLNARDVLTNPAVWPALKRAIKNQELRIEDPYEQFGLVAPQAMRPEPMPIKVKIVLIGDAMLYQLLSMYDEDFWEIFKVKADFNFEVERSKENIEAYCAFVSNCCRDYGTRHFDRTGVARVIEYAARLVGDQDRLSSRFAQLRELIEEAEYWANKNGARLISAKHVNRAIEERLFRHNLLEERIGDMINKGTIMIDTEGAVVGQVNGLSVYALGDITFGKPSRITANTFIGRSGIINIERESQLSGGIHDKGVMILSGYLGSKYAQDKPLSLSASLCFEQSYEGVDGDSASSTELYAVLSSLSEVPIGQNIAVTGSVNQKGEIQPIGGVNRKIEGFFEVCKARGLSGDQGVLIPFQNLRNLMLRDEVVDAVQKGKFHIYTVKTIDEGIEVLTGKDAGGRRDDGTYSEESINYRVDKRLKEMAEQLKGFQTAEKKNDGNHE
ncbi:Lon protease family protein [Chloroflexota bacterium]